MSRHDLDPLPDDRHAWILLETDAPPAGEAHLLVDALHRLGARSVEREGRGVAALFPPHDDPALLAAEARIALRASTGSPDPVVTWRRLSSAERAARLGAAPPPVHAGGQRIRLEPSTAFGTAEHPTTRSCLRLLEGRVSRGDSVLDVGAGSAILAMAAVAFGARRATALESDPAACAAARRNVALNGLRGRVRVREVVVIPGSLGRRARYDGVVANIQAGILRPLVPDLAGAARRGGWVIVSGVLRSERDEVLQAALDAGLREDRVEDDDGWWTAALTRH